MTMHLVTDFETAPEAQMLLDEQLAHAGKPHLRLFTWPTPAISYGFRQALPAWLSEVACPVVERPTGGGLALHGTDLSWSIVMPIRPGDTAHEVLFRIGRQIERLCRGTGAPEARLIDRRERERVTICLTDPSPYAIEIQGRKLAGLALRRFRSSWLVQGSMLVRPVSEAVLRQLPEQVRQQWTSRSIAFNDASASTMSELELATWWAAAWMLEPVTGTAELAHAV